MLKATELKIGIVFEYEGEPYRVLEYRHTHLARGSADVRLKIKGLISSTTKPAVFAPDDRFEEVSLTKKSMQFLYREGNELIFMDPESYEQIELKEEIMEEMVDFLKDGEVYEVLYWDDKALDVLIPPKIELEVLECDPGIKGNSAANMYMSAVVEGGISLKVPLFIKPGEKIRVDTVNRKYVERAKH